jgi:hypothetical protein
MENELIYLFNLPKDHAAEYIKEHQDCMIGKSKDAGCYYGIQLDGMGIVGVYQKQKETEEKKIED